MTLLLSYSTIEIYYPRRSIIQIIGTILTTHFLMILQQKIVVANRDLVFSFSKSSFDLNLATVCHSLRTNLTVTSSDFPETASKSLFLHCVLITTTEKTTNTPICTEGVSYNTTILSRPTLIPVFVAASPPSPAELKVPHPSTAVCPEMRHFQNLIKQKNITWIE